MKRDGRLGELEYWGPARRLNTLDDGDPVGSDAMGSRPNHPDGGCNLLRKSADVIMLSAEDWAGLDRTLVGDSPMTRPIP